MNWFVHDRKPDALPPVAVRTPGTGEEFALAMQEFWQRQDTWFRSNSLRDDLLGEMAGALGEPAFTYGGPRGRQHADRIADLTAKMARARAAGAPFGGLPASPEEFQAEAARRHEREYGEIVGLLAQGDSPVVQFAGTMAGAIIDPVNLVAGLLGGAPKIGQLGRFILSEAALNAAAEVPGVIRERQVADELGLETPTSGQSVANVALGGLGGAALASVVAGGVKALHFLKDRAAAEHAARPAELSPLEYENGIAAAEAAMRGGKPPPPAPLRPDPQLAAGADPAVANVLRFIRQIEAPGGYDQVFSGIAPADRPPKPLTQMTIDDVLAWQDSIDPRYNSEAAGAYQIIEDTLRDLVAREGLGGGELFDQAMQDRLAIALMRDAGLEDWRAGRIGAAAFNDRLAGVWAAIPDSRTGQSRYAGDGMNAARTSPEAMLAVLNGERAPDRAAAYATSRGYTGTGQVRVGDWGRVDVVYEVVDAALLRPAAGRFQPRDRGQVNSDAWVAATAADLDPAQLMPGPNAATGAPLVGPDLMIESGNGRVMAIERAYDLHPDRAAAYRAEIERVTGEPIPEGVERPVLVARRTTGLSDEARERLTVAAQDSGVAQLTPIETARVGARQITPERLALLDPARPLADAANRGFVMKVAEALPKGVRNAIFAGGELNDFGEDLLSGAIFARAWPDGDILAMLMSRRAGRDMRGLLDALEEAAPAWAAMRAEIAAGTIDPAFDITGHVLEAMRLIADARRTASAEGRPIAAVLRELLDQGDIEGPLSPLTRALIGKFWPDGRVAPADRIAAFLKAYAAEAGQAGRAGGMFDGASPAEVLRRIDGETFAGLPEDFGRPRPVSTRGMAAELDPDPVIDTAGLDGSPYLDGAAAPAVARIDDAIAADLAQAADEEAGVRAGLAAFADEVVADRDGNVLLDVRAMLADLDADRALTDVMDVCRMKRMPR